jgi:predicted O-linked N-acetylglucosamine transferase (SPINDLY family)
VLWLAIDDTTARNNLGTEATKRGVDQSRLVFSPRVAYDEHLARFQLADLFLDTLPFNAGTTASDALWAGVPVLTCAGDAFAGRMAGSLLQTMGLPGLITHSLAEYESLARTLALDTTRLCAIRARLAAQRTSSALFNTRTFTRNIEAAYGEMWRIHERGEPPRSFSSPAS